MISDEYRKAYTEVLEILKYLPEESVAKIPENKLDFYKQNMDKSYNYKIDESKDFEEQEMSDITRAILAIIYRDYWASPIERLAILNQEAKDMAKYEKEKFFSDRDKQSNSDNKSTQTEYDDFEKEFAKILNDDETDWNNEFASLFEETEGPSPSEFDFNHYINIRIDVALCIDVTSSMQPILDTVKGMALSLYDDMVDALAKKRRRIIGFRVKVIAFRDYYYDGQYAMDESKFFNLPEQSVEFNEYVSGLKADGGGDEPENALEAIALAMKSDWVQALSSNEKARNIIVVFTDASAHPFEKAKEGVTQFYPDNMLTSLEDLKMAWEGQNSLGGASLTDIYRMDPQAKRLIVYSPLDSYPWNEFALLTYVKTSSIEPAKGGKELDRQILLDDIVGDIR